MTTTMTIPTLTDDEVKPCLIVDKDAGFGALTTERGPLPLQAMDVRTRIDGLLAEVALAQTFVNTHQGPLEATYIFPLPDRAAVTEFRMEVGGRVIEGVLKERAQARKEYDEAIQEGHRAAITEEERSGVFTMRVGNLPPGETATVRLTLTGPLVFDSGEATFRFPLVVAPRYIPGTPLPGRSVGSGVAEDTGAVPDASRISPPVLLPGYPNPVQLSLTVEVEPSALAPREFRSSLHAVLQEEGGYGRRVIRLHPGERLDRDFVLRFRVGDESVRTALALVPDVQGGQEGTFLLTLVPPTGAMKGIKPRDVVFVLDRSGSMDGWKMVAARRALGRMVDTLTERDRFSVLAFDDVVETPSEAGLELTEATDRNRFRAIDFLGRVEARNGTEMAGPLEEAVRQLEQVEAGRDRVLVLITDGQVGNEDQILKVLGGRLAGLRVFTLGIDQAVNEGFLRRLAMLGGGFSEVIESEDRLDEVMHRLHRRLAPPVLRNLKLEASGLRIDPATVVPGRLPDLFPGAVLQVSGRYWGAPEGALRMGAEDLVGRKWTETASARKSDNGALTKTWARAYLRELEDRYTVGQEEAETLDRKIIETSLRFGVLCRFTAFVAVDRSAVVNPGGVVREMVQPVELPSGWTYPAAGACCLMAPAPTTNGGPSYYCSSSIEEDYDGGFDGEEPEECNGGSEVEDYQEEGTDMLEKAVLGSFDVGEEDEPQEEAGEEEHDWSAYRRRAAELVERIRAVLALTVEERGEELYWLPSEINALVEDLKCMGFAEECYGPLEETQIALQQVFTLDPADSEVERLLRDCEEALRHFAENEEMEAEDRSDSFWK